MRVLLQRGVLILAAMLGIAAAGSACAQEFAAHTFHVYVIEMNALARQRAAVQAYIADGWRRWGAPTGAVAQDGVVILLNGSGATVPRTLELEHDRTDQAERISSYLSRQLSRAGTLNGQYPGLDLGEAQAEAAKAVDRQIASVDRESKRRGTVAVGKLTVVLHIVADQVYFRRPSEARQSLGDFGFADACFVRPEGNTAIAERLQRFRPGSAQRDMAVVLVQPRGGGLAPPVEKAIALTLGGPDPAAAGMAVYRDGVDCVDPGDAVSIAPGDRGSSCAAGEIAGGGRSARDPRSCLPAGSADAVAKLQARLLQVFGSAAANAVLPLTPPPAPARPPETAPLNVPAPPPKTVASAPVQPPPAPVPPPKASPPAPQPPKTAALPPPAPQPPPIHAPPARPLQPLPPPVQQPPPAQATPAKPLQPLQPPPAQPPPVQVPPAQVPPAKPLQPLPPSASLDQPPQSGGVADDGTVRVRAQRRPAPSSSQFVIEGRLPPSAATLTIIAKPLSGAGGELIVSQKVSNRPAAGDYALFVRVPRGYPCRDDGRLFFTFKLDGFRVDPDSQGLYSIDIDGACGGRGVDVAFGRMRIK